MVRIIVEITLDVPIQTEAQARGYVAEYQALLDENNYILTKLKYLAWSKD